MNQKKIVLAIATILFTYLSFLPTYVYNNLASPPVGYTGAPNELTCNAAGCHTGVQESTDPTKLTLGTISGPPLSNNTGYVPGTTYNFFVNLNSNTTIHGFQMTALDQSGNGVGTFSLSNPTKTTLGTQGNRQYVGQLNESGSGWTFKWQAPPSNAGTISFYMTGLGANNSGTIIGDQVYRTKYTVTTSSFTQNNLTGIHEISNVDNNSSIHVYPNPVIEKLKVDYLLDKNETVQVNLFSLDGKLVKELYFSEDTKGDHHQTFDLQGKFSGLYLLKINIGENIFYKKIFTL